VDHFNNLGLYAGKVSTVVESLNHESLKNALALLDRASNEGLSVFVAGNGGSAATASHFVTDLNKRSPKSKLSAISLCDNTSLMTMISNDYGFDQVFLKQLENLAKPNSILVLISASGNSKNLVEATGWANQQGIKTIALTGFDGGILAKIANISLYVHTEIGAYAMVEDAHSIICHFISVTLRGEKL
jgi:D-sedoheptulose 7-phosphate isomerase